MISKKIEKKSAEVEKKNAVMDVMLYYSILSDDLNLSACQKPVSKPHPSPSIVFHEPS